MEQARAADCSPLSAVTISRPVPSWDRQRGFPPSERLPPTDRPHLQHLLSIREHQVLTQTHFPPAPGFSRNHDPPASSLPWNLLGWFLGGLSCSRSANSFQPRLSEPHPDPAGGGGQGVPARPSLARSSVPECQASVNARLRSCLPLPLCVSSPGPFLGLDLVKGQCPMPLPPSLRGLQSSLVSTGVEAGSSVTQYEIFGSCA